MVHLSGFSKMAIGFLVTWEVEAFLLDQILTAKPAWQSFWIMTQVGGILEFKIQFFFLSKFNA